MKYKDFVKNFNITKEKFNGLDRDDLLYAIYQQNYITFNLIEDFLDYLEINIPFLREIANKSFYDKWHKISCDEMGCHYERYKKSYEFNKNCQISKIE